MRDLSHMMNEQELVDALVATGHWSAKMAWRGVKSGFCCIYCGGCFHDSVNSYREWSEDHLVPKSRGGGDEENNLVLACRTCNLIKLRWDPRKAYPDNPSPTREELIEAAKNYILPRRSSVEAIIQGDLELINKSVVGSRAKITPRL
jgi:5-methylcytosine-specific restriction endonuclease McrA